MVLKDVHDKQEDIPEAFRELYTEKNGKWECTGIQGMKTQADVDRVQTGLTKEREDHKATKGKLAVWGDMVHDDVVATLDRVPELEAAAKGKLDEAQIEEIVTRRVDGTIKSKLAPVERELKTVTAERDELKGENVKFLAANVTRTIHKTVRAALVESKVLPDAHEDALLLADRVFEVREDDKAIVTRDQVGVTPGLDPTGWLAEIQPRRRHWWPESVGGGAKGSGGGGGGFGGKNPWSYEGWNMTEQGRFIREHGRERADSMAKAAGTVIGGKKPAPKKASIA